jgi:glyoxylase-like metal-dependent hydrolase (beta-lactamase superfamily II)
MAIQLRTYVLGPLQNNTYLVIDKPSGDSIIIDPAIGSHVILEDLKKNKLTLKQIWITHAHFDHIGGVESLSRAFLNPIPVAMHPTENDLWEGGGGAKELGFELNLGPLPSHPLMDGQILNFGSSHFEVFLTPGHTPGHVVFYNTNEGLAFCGDLLFRHAVGRSDFKGGNYEQLIASIKNRIFTLPDETRLLSGHGPDTTVGEERKENPFLK